MRLYNTLGRIKSDFKPQKDNVVTLYTCGPTVYDYAHIGNLRAFIFYDTLRRALEDNGYNVKHVMNITDVGHLVGDEVDEGEDKFEKGARREGKTVWDVAAFYTDAFKADSKAVGLLPPNGYHDPKAGDTYARATNFINEQIEMIKLLLENGYAYQTKQAIYFDVTKLPDYGKLTGQKLTDKEVAARQEVVTDPDKHHPYDFSVWFFAVGKYKDHSMKWPSPWGDGFPGWHLECSAIIHTVLGDPIDVHTGGIDHIGTHHTNEIAQTEAAFGHDLAHVWMHNEFMLVDGSKMAKSKGNFYTLRDVIEHKFAPLAFRLLVLQAHYRSEINFTFESIQAAQNTLLNLYAWADLRFQGQKGSPTKRDVTGDLNALKEPLQDDLDTPSLLANLFQIIDASWSDLSPSDYDIVLPALDKILGLGLDGRHDLTRDEKNLIEKRDSARQGKYWKRSDALRAELAEHHLEVNDTPEGPRWRRTAIS